MKRREIRILAVQALYQLDMTGCTSEHALQSVLDGEQVDPFLQELVNGVLNHQQQIDVWIRQALDNWELERLSRVDRAILRLATYELTSGAEQQLPTAIVINEAVDLGKLFGTDENGKFINGVLSNIKTYV